MKDRTGRTVAEYSLPSRCGGRFQTGGTCPWAPSEFVNGLALCREHVSVGIEATFRARDNAPTPEMLRRYARSRKTMVAAVVYYIGDPANQLVKIGTSTDLAARMTALRYRRPNLLLLATEPGTYPAERDRKSRFADFRARLRTGETEWFHKSPELMTHINLMRVNHGIIYPGPDVNPEWIAPVRRS